MEDKLERSLSKILDSTYTLSDDSILAQLEKHLEDQVESDDFSHWKDTILLPWCLRVIPQWESLKRNIKLFVIQVVKILTNNSRDLSKILASDLLNRIRDKVCPMMVKEISQYDLPLIVNYIQLMNNVIRHSDGVNWFMDSGTTIFFDLLISKHNMMRSQNLIDTVERLLSDTIAVLHESDIEKCFQLIDQIMKPLGLERSEPRTPQMDQLFEKAETYLSTKKETLIKFTSLQSALKNVPFINLLNCLLETKQPHLGICKALAEYNFEEWLWIKAFSIDITPDHIGSYIKLIIYIKFSEFDNSMEKLDEILLTVSFLHRLAFLRKRPDLVYDIMLLCMQLSSLRASPEPTTDYSLDSNLFSIFIVPLQPFSGFPFCSRSVIWEFPDIFSNLLIDDKVEVIRSTFKVISRMKGSNLLDKKKMNIIFGTFISILGTYQKMFQKKDPQNELQKADIVCPVKYLSSILSFYPKFLAEIVSLLEDLVKSQVKDDWCSCSQTDTGMISLRTIIDFEEVDTYAKGKILSLLTTILNVLKPNDNPSINDAFVKKRLYPLKHLLLKYICHPEWGIRDSVIELIKSMTIQSQQGFSRITNLLLDSNIALAIFNVAFVFNENEDYIKISALRCLQMMVQSKQIWEELFALNILDTLLYLLSSEDSKNASNSLVRAELISLIARIYEAGGISESQIDSVYKQMVYYAIDDLYWEVKVNALSFWKAVMKSVYEENCLVDGQFPYDSNPAGNAKSKLMLEKILSRLNSIGCLQVLWETLNDACDFTVARVSASILSNLVDILKRYNHLEIPNRDQSAEIEVDVAHNDSCNQDQITVRDIEPGSETIIANDVINSIVDSRDTDLLLDLSTAKASTDDNQRTETAKRRKSRNNITSHHEFLSKLSAINLEAFIQEKEDWLKSTDGFSALMDTILGFDSNRDESINRIDCY